ncbi:MAG TPA: HAD-IB family hydrolase, partial [Actinomycetes bacterium]|nr:HAD-IB family hydrolase [Actinomycetes bacterium]
MVRITRRKDEAPAVVAGEAAAAVAEVEAALAPNDPTAAAFFDIDNTVVRGASVFHLAMGLASRKFFTAGDVSTFVWQQVKFRIAGREDLEDMHSAVEAALSFVAGHSVDEVVQLGQEIFDERIADKLYAGTIALANTHLEAGQRVWLVSAAPIELASIIAAKLGLTGALGTVSEVDGTLYTGKLVGAPLHGPAKAEAVRALADREGLDLSQCSAYSDSSNDVPMLSVVGHPVAVNPDSGLRRHARAMGWEVHDYRTARKAAKVGVPTAVAIGVAAGV